VQHGRFREKSLQRAIILCKDTLFLPRKKSRDEEGEVPEEMIFQPGLQVSNHAEAFDH
jgi:hypothetical protein